MLTVNRYRLTPTPEQAASFAQWSGCARWTYNAALDAREATYNATGKGLGTTALCRLLTGWRLQHDWLRDFPAQAAQQAIRNLTDAYTRFFKGQNSRPTFKRKGKSRDSFRVPQQSGTLRMERLNRRNARLKLPKVGWVRLRYHRLIKGQIRSVTVSREAGRWYASILLKTDEEAPEAPKAEEVSADRSVGIDLGVAQTVTTSDGEVFSVPTMIPGDERHLRRLQRRMSRRQSPRRGKKGQPSQPASKRWLKAKAALQQFHAKQRRKRLDAIHKLTAVLTSGEHYDAITMEDLDTKGMTSRKKGKGRRAKAKLNRAILSQAWGEIQRQCEYKARRAGIAFRVVDPAYTSQKCSKCGHTERKNRRTQAVFRCVVCGHTSNADLNAAMNIRAAGHVVQAAEVVKARGGDVRRQEPAATLVRVAAPVKREALAGQQLRLF